MYTFEKSIYIERPQEDVYDFVTDPAKSSEWQSGVETAEWISPSPRGVGSTWRVVNKFLGRKIEAELEVSDWDRPNKIRSKIVQGPLPFDVTITFEPKENGTQLTMKSEGEFGGFFKLAEGMVGKQAEKQVASDLAALKLLMESD